MGRGKGMLANHLDNRGLNTDFHEARPSLYRLPPCGIQDKCDRQRRDATECSGHETCYNMHQLSGTYSVLSKQSEHKMNLNVSYGMGVKPQPPLSHSATVLQVTLHNYTAIHEVLFVRVIQYILHK